MATRYRQFSPLTDLPYCTQSGHSTHVTRHGDVTRNLNCTYWDGADALVSTAIGYLLTTHSVINDQSTVNSAAAIAHHTAMHGGTMFEDDQEAERRRRMMGRRKQRRERRRLSKHNPGHISEEEKVWHEADEESGEEGEALLEELLEKKDEETEIGRFMHVCVCARAAVLPRREYAHTTESILHHARTASHRSIHRSDIDAPFDGCAPWPARSTD